MSAQRKRQPENSRVRVFLGDPALAEPLARAALEELIAEDARDLDVEIVRMPSDPIERVREALAQVGMFSRDRCVLLRGPLDDASTTDALVSMLEGGLPPRATLIIVAPKLDGRGRLFRWLQQHAQVDDLRVERKWDGRIADVADLESFVRNHAANNGFPEPSPAVVDAIVSRAGADLTGLAHEIDKLCLAIDPPRALRRDDVERNVRDMAGAWIFDFMDALLERRKQAAQTIVVALLADGEPPLRLVAALGTRTADFLLAAKVAEMLRLPPPPAVAAAFIKTVYPQLPEATRRRFNSPYRAYHVFRVAQARGFRSLRDLHRRLLQLDVDLKSGVGQARHLLADFVESASGPRA